MAIIRELPVWGDSPFTHQCGDFWDPRHPDVRYAGAYFTHMGLPFVEIPRTDRPDRDWGMRSIAGDLQDGREVLLLAHSGATYSIEVVRGDERFDRYSGVAALLGAGATGVSEETLIRSGSIQGQSIERWMGMTSSSSALIGCGFLAETGVPKIIATVERESRLLTVDLGEGVPLRRALTVLDEALFLVRKTIGCLTGVRTVARDETVRTDSGEVLTWQYARWETPLWEPLTSAPFVALTRSGTSDTLVNRFEQARQALWPIADMLYVNLPSSGIYTEHRFASLISALEGVHPKLALAVEDKRWVGEEEVAFKVARSILKAHLTAAGNESLKSAMLTSLQNKRTLAQKLADILDYLGSEVETILQVDRAAWIRMATDHRNTTAHVATTSTPTSDIAEDSSKYRALSVVAEEMLRQLLLVKMEIGDSARESSALRAGSKLRTGGYDGFLVPRASRGHS